MNLFNSGINGRDLWGLYRSYFRTPVFKYVLLYNSVLFFKGILKLFVLWLFYQSMLLVDAPKFLKELLDLNVTQEKYVMILNRWSIFSIIPVVFIFGFQLALMRKIHLTGLMGVYSLVAYGGVSILFWVEGFLENIELFGLFSTVIVCMFLMRFPKEWFEKKIKMNYQKIQQTPLFETLKKEGIVVKSITGNELELPFLVGGSLFYSQFEEMEGIKMKTIELFELVSVNENTLIFKNSDSKEVSIAVSEGLANQCLKELQEANQENEPLLMEKKELDKMRGNHGL